MEKIGKYEIIRTLGKGALGLFFASVLLYSQAATTRLRLRYDQRPSA